MATKIQQILETAPNESVLFGSWLSSQGLDARGQYAYMKSGWLDRISKGVYKIHGTDPNLFAAVSSYNTQLSKSCVEVHIQLWNFAEGLFVFENSTLEHLMDVLAQWYDIKKVNYTDDKLRKIHFTGNLKRYGSAERIMKAIMMACDVNIVLQNDTLSVSN
ncbi:MAG: AbiEi antitoxin N-terminal domain-containing protein [Prevotella sp.]|nr:AbiEi antitoxin N-terminal domain-containing protein [Prevotella sp.]